MFYISGNLPQVPTLAAATTTSVVDAVTSAAGAAEQALDFTSALSAAGSLAGRAHASLASFTQQFSPQPIGNLPPTACGIFVGGVAGGLVGLLSAPAKCVVERVIGLGEGQLVDDSELSPDGMKRSTVATAIGTLVATGIAIATGWDMAGGGGIGLFIGVAAKLWGPATHYAKWREPPSNGGEKWPSGTEIALSAAKFGFAGVLATWVTIATVVR